MTSANSISVFYLEDTELAEFEASNKGYRNDIYVKILNDLFNIKVYDIVRLKQDFELESESYGYYSVEPNLIIVKEVTKEAIEFVVKKLYEQKYFESIKTVDDDKLVEYLQMGKGDFLFPDQSIKFEMIKVNSYYMELKVGDGKYGHFKLPSEEFIHALLNGAEHFYRRYKEYFNSHDNAFYHSKIAEIRRSI